MAGETETLSYASAQTEAMQIREPATVGRRMSGGVGEAALTLVVMMMTAMVAFGASPWMRHSELVGTALGAIAVFGMEVQGRNFSRTLADLRLIFSPGTALWRKWVRSMLVHPFVSLLLASQLAAFFAVYDLDRSVLAAGTMFCVVDFVLLVATKRRIGDYVGRAWVVRAYELRGGSRADLLPMRYE